MAEESRVQLKVRITSAGHHENLPEAEGSLAFWMPLIERESARYSQGSAPHPPSIASLERRLKLRFVRNVKAELVGYFSAYPSNYSRESIVAGSLPTKYATLLPLIGLELTNISYGSLDLTLEIIGLNHLVDLFDSNFDLFSMFMQVYLPTAFCKSFHNLSLDEEDFQFDVLPTPRLISAFSASSEILPPVVSSGPTEVTGNSDQSARVKTMWLLTNYTLVVPVLLSLGVIYVAARQVAEERSELHALRKDLSSREQAFVETAVERLVEIEKLQSELIEKLAPSTSKISTEEK